MRSKLKLLASVACISAIAGLPSPAAAQEFLYFFTDDFNSYQNNKDFVGTNGQGTANGWVGGYVNGTRGGNDTWKTNNNRIQPRSDTHCGQQYGNPDDNCAMGWSTYTGGVGSYSTPPSSGVEPEDNWVVKWEDASLDDPQFQMIFQFDNSDDDSIGMVFRQGGTLDRSAVANGGTANATGLPDSENFYMFQWSWREGLDPSDYGKHIWNVSCCDGGHIAPVCASDPSPPASCTDVTTPASFQNRLVGRAAGHGGWLYRVRNGVITELANTTTSYIRGQTYNVMIRGTNHPDAATCNAGLVSAANAPNANIVTAAACNGPGGQCSRLTIWMDRTNDGFQDADVLIDICDGDTEMLPYGGAYGLFQYDNSAFIVDGFVAEEAPLPPTIDPASVAVTPDHRNGFLDFAAVTNRNAQWTLTVSTPDTPGTCAGGTTPLFTENISQWTRSLTYTFPGVAPGGSYCYTAVATNSLGSDSYTYTGTPITILPRFSATQPGIVATSPTTVDYNFSASIAATGDLDYQANDCAGGGYALRSGVSGANSFAQTYDRPALRLGTSHTAEAWVYTEATSGGWTRVLGKGTSANNTLNYGLYTHADGTVSYSVGDATGLCSAVSNAGVVQNATWHHLAGRYNGTLVEVLADGVVVGATACTKTPIADASPFVVGYDGEFPAFQGLIAHVLLFASNQPTSDLADRAEAGPVPELTGSDENPILAWHFREHPVVQAVWDDSGSDHHGYLGSSSGVDAGDPERFPSFGVVPGNDPVGFADTVTGLAAGIAYCARGVADATGDDRLAVSPVRTFELADDSIPPVVTAGGSLQLECGSPAGTSSTLTAATVTDETDASPQVRAFIDTVGGTEITGPPFTYTFPYGAPGPLTTVVWQGLDAGGNSATGTQVVWVQDTTAPSLGTLSNLTVEATDPAGTPVSFAGVTATDACDATVTLGNNGPATYATGSTTTVTFTATDDAGNQAVGSLDVSIADTTAPRFADDPTNCPATLPLRKLNISCMTPPCCYTGPLPPPTATDNGYSAGSLSYFIEGPDADATYEALFAASDDQYCTGGGNVTVNWRVEDPAGNRCDATQEVELGVGSFSTNFQGLSYDGTYANANLANNNTFHNGSVTMAVEIAGCTGGTVTYFPAADSTTNNNGSDPSEHTGTFNAEGSYQAVLAYSECNPGTGAEFGIAGPAVFGIDKVAPLTDFSEILNLNVVGTDASTYARMFFGEDVDLSKFEAFDTAGPVQSGIDLVQIFVEKVTNPTLGTFTPELTLGSLDPVPTGSPLAIGPATLGSFACDSGGSTVCPDTTSLLDIQALSVFDSNLHENHRLRIITTDAAGNSTEQAYFIALRDYNDMLIEATTAADDLILDPFNLIALDELEDAEAELTVAASYMLLSRPYVEGSLLRTQYTIDAYADAEDFGVLVGNQREYLTRASWGLVKLHVDSLTPSLPSDSTYVSNATTDLNNALTDRSVGNWSAMMTDVRSARDAVALLYPDYQALRSKQSEADTAFANFDPANATWDSTSMPHITPTQEMVTEALAVLKNSVKPEIEAALTDSGTTQTLPLQTIVDAITSVDACLTDLSTFTLNDREYTQCYLAIDDMAQTLSSVEISLVSTYRWQAAMALALFSMLDISLNLSPTGLNWVVAGGIPPTYVSPAQMASFDTDADAAYAGYTAAVQQLDAGDVLTAYTRFSENRCLLVTLYNRYYSSDATTQNVSGSPTYEAPLVPAEYGCTTP